MQVCRVMLMNYKAFSHTLILNFPAPIDKLFIGRCSFKLPSALADGQAEKELPALAEHEDV
jgi:hypothetical protein